MKGRGNRTLLNRITIGGTRFEFPTIPQYRRTDRKKHGATDNRPVFQARVMKRGKDYGQKDSN